MIFAVFRLRLLCPYNIC